LLLVWRSGKGVRHINEVKLRRVRLVLGLVTTSNIPARPIRSTQPGQPSVGRCNEYRRWFVQSLGKKQRVLRSSRPCYQDCWRASSSHLKALAVNLSVIQPTGVVVQVVVLWLNWILPSPAQSTIKGKTSLATPSI